MNRLSLALSCAVLLVLAPSRNARAETLGFDDLTGVESPVPAGYNGFNFTNFYDITSSFAAQLGTNNGYFNGIVSPSTAIFNGNGNPASFSSTGGTFTLGSMELTSAWNNGLNVQVTGYANGVLLETANLTVNEAGPTLETLNWAGVDTIEFASSGGTSILPGQAPGEEFVLDDLAVTPSSAITPEPGSFVLLGTGMLGLLGVARRRVFRH